MSSLITTDFPRTFGDRTSDNRHTAIPTLRLTLGPGSTDRTQSPRVITATGNMELILVVAQLEPILGSISNHGNGIPNALTVKAMNEAREGKRLARFKDAKALFDDLGI